MTERKQDTHGFNRRTFVAGTSAAAAAGILSPWADIAAALGPKTWPDGKLGLDDATRVRARQFISKGQLEKWHDELDSTGPMNQRGLRATGSKAERDYLDRLRKRFKRAGASNVRFEAFDIERWTTDEWSLNIESGPYEGPVKTASYIPYSGQTPGSGVTGELVYVGSTIPAPGTLTGKIAVFDVPVLTVPLSVFTALGYPGATYDPPPTEIDPSTEYRRPYLSIETLIERLEALEPAGAVGAVGIIPYPYAAAKGFYAPYDGEIREVPGLYVDREVGETMKAQAQAGGVQATLALPSKIKSTQSRNLLAVVPGQSDEVVVLHSHSDGTNAIEENGCDAMVAAAQYIARLPKRALPRTIMFLVTSGHFTGGSGVRAFLDRHKSDLVPRINAAVTVEHLGAQEWNEVSPGEMALTGRNEPGAVFTIDSEEMVAASYDALVRGKADPSGVLRPLNPTGTGEPNDAVWPGEGQYLYGLGGIPTANFITGPTYLLNWGIKTKDKIDFKLMRKEAIAFTEEVLRLGRAEREALQPSS